MPKVCVTGWYDKKNTGDESYKLAFPICFPDIEFVFSDTPQPADAYVLGGGDIIVPSFLSSMDAIKQKKTILSVSINKHDENVLLKDYAQVFVRDMQSLLVVSEIGIKASFCPDLAFSLTANPSRGKELRRDYFRKEKAEHYDKVVGIVINAHLSTYSGSSAAEAYQFDNFCFEMAKTIDETDASFMFIPFGKTMPWDDRSSNSIVANRCKFWKKNIVIYDEMSVQDTLDLISSANCMVSTRLHSTIFSLVAGTPLLDITHNHKNRNLLETVRAEEFSMPFRSFNYQDAKRRLSQILQMKEHISQQIKIIGEEQKQKVKEITKNVCLV